MKENLKGKKGITLIALVITIIVLLILAGVSIAMLTGQNGLLSQAINAKDETIIAEEKEQVEVAYASANIKKRGEDVTQKDLQEELDKVVKTSVETNSDGTLNVLFEDTKNNYNVNKGEVSKVEPDTTMAVFDTGENVAIKIRMLALEGNYSEEWPTNLSIDGIKRYTEGTPDSSKMTDSNIVSWVDGYTAYEQNPGAFSEMVPEGTTLFPIYMWFEESGETEIRDILGSNQDNVAEGVSKEVKTGILYWWSESNNVYLNPNSSSMFALLPYLSDLSGLENVKTKYTTNISSMFASPYSNQRLTNVNALSNWDTSNITDISGLFSYCASLSDISGLRNWDTSNITNISSLFANCTSLIDISGLKNWDTSKVVNMYNTFAGDDGPSMKLTNLDALSNWDVSNVENMQRMFLACRELTDTSAIEDWDITKVSNFNEMFFDVPVKPNFTKVSGIWNESGTFIPNN